MSFPEKWGAWKAQLQEQRRSFCFSCCCKFLCLCFGVTNELLAGSLVVTQGMPCRPGKVKGSPLAGFANGMCLYVWEVTFRVSQEPDFSVEALLEGWLLFDSIKENLFIHGFWCDSSVVKPDLSFRN